MCGIFCVIEKSTNDFDFNRAITSTRMMSHRGPDHQGFMLATSKSPKGSGITNVSMTSPYDVFMGHTRLSIIDLSDCAHQPMCNEDSSVWVAYNGEIYNFRELKVGLAKNHVFKSNSDTEILVHAYEEYGDSFVKKLQGMFAFVILDKNKKRIVFARDNAGIKPLYVHRNDSTIVISSEIRPILEFIDSKLPMDKDSLMQFMTLGYVQTPRSPYRGIEKIPPSCFGTIDLGNGRPDFKIAKYWEADMTPPENPTEKGVLARMEELLESSVKGCLISDVPVGIFLSGGTDSSLITFLASRMKKDTLKTFSIGFERQAWDESPYALEVSKIFSTDHHHYKVDSAFLDYLPSVIESIEEPLSDTSAIPLWYLSQEASKEVKVVLSGEGGDELFGGYTRYFWDKVANAYSVLPLPLRKGLAAFTFLIKDSGEMSTLNTKRRFKKFLSSGVMDNVKRYSSWFHILLPEEVNDLLSEPLRQEAAWESFRQYMNAFKNSSALQRNQYADLRTMLLDYLLLKADKLSMAHSLEVRVPLLTPGIINFGLSMPDSMKIRSRQTKYVMRRFLKGKIPDEVIFRRKQGLEMPIGGLLLQRNWDKTRKNIEKLSSRYGIVKSSKLNELLNGHESRKADVGRKIYNLLVLATWLERYSKYLKTE